MELPPEDFEKQSIRIHSDPEVQQSISTLQTYRTIKNAMGISTPFEATEIKYSQNGEKGIRSISGSIEVGEEYLRKQTDIQKLE